MSDYIWAERTLKTDAWSGYSAETDGWSQYAGETDPWSAQSNPDTSQILYDANGEIVYDRDGTIRRMRAE
jgi:hypothetical protein